MLNEIDKILLKVVLMWQRNCAKYSGCEDCPFQGDCIVAKELILERLEGKNDRT